MSSHPYLLLCISLFFSLPSSRGASALRYDPQWKDPVVDGSVTALASLQDGSLIIGGAFTNVSGERKPHLAKLTANGELVKSWTPAPIGGMYPATILPLRNGKIIVQGVFTNVDGESRQGLARLNGDGSLDRQFYPPPSISAFGRLSELPNDRLLVAWLDFVRRRFHVLMEDGSLDLSVPPESYGQVAANRKGEIIVERSGGNQMLDAAGRATGVTIPGTICFLDEEGPLVMTTSETYSHGPSLGGFERYFSGGGPDTHFAIATPPVPTRALEHYFYGYADLVRDAQGGFYYAGRPILPISAGPDLVYVSPVGTTRIVATNLPLSGSNKIFFQEANKLLLIIDGQVSRILTDTVVEGPPIPTSFPKDGVAPLGSAFQFSTHWEGSVQTNEVTYQWMRNGAPIPGATTKDLILPQVKLADAGLYQLIASNRYGVAATKGARLDVGVFQPGTHDPSFLPDISSPVLALAVQQDGKLLVSSREGGLVRLHENGARDHGFTAPVSLSPPHLLHLHSDKVLVVDSIGLKRLMPNGALDSTLASGVSGFISDIAIDAQGRIILAGSLQHEGRRGCLARLKDNGQLDGPFFFLEDQGVRQIAIQRDGRILLGGSFSRFNGVNRAGLVLLNPDNWFIDNSFPFVAGFQVESGKGLQIGSVNDVLVNHDGSYLVGGVFTRVDQRPWPALARIMPDGTPDWSYFVDPRMKFRLQNGPAALARQKDGKIILAGAADPYGQPAPIDIGLFRLLPSGHLDPSFRPARGSFQALAIDSAGDIFAGGVGPAFLVKVFGSDPGRRLKAPSPESSLYSTEILTLSNKTYHFDYAPAVSGPWASVTNFVGDGKTAIIHDQREMSPRSGYYRLQVEME